MIRRLLFVAAVIAFLNLPVAAAAKSGVQIQFGFEIKSKSLLSSNIKKSAIPAMILSMDKLGDPGDLNPASTEAKVFFLIGLASGIVVSYVVRRMMRPKKRRRSAGEQEKREAKIWEESTAAAEARKTNFQKGSEWIIEKFSKQKNQEGVTVPAEEEKHPHETLEGGSREQRGFFENKTDPKAPSGAGSDQDKEGSEKKPERENEHGPGQISAEQKAAQMVWAGDDVKSASLKPTHSGTLYFPNPNNEGEFRKADGKDSYIESASIYKFTIDRSGTSAKFEFCPERTSVNIALNNRNELILSVAEEANAYTSHASRIEIVDNKKGEAILEGATWKVITKAKIKYV